MKSIKPHHCLNCRAVFTADPRNVRHQKYCAAPDCRKVSKAASQALWGAKAENLHYHRGPVAVARVRAWQNDHPEYRAQQGIKRAIALQDHCPVQVLDFKQETVIVAPNQEEAGTALQDFINTQPLVFVGFIAHFFNMTLQDDIANTARCLQQLGEDIAYGRGTDAFLKTAHLCRTVAGGANAV